MEKRKSLWEWNSDSSVVQLVALPTELSGLVQINIDAVVHNWD
jgi:hypothetical protein